MMRSRLVFIVAVAFTLAAPSSVRAQLAPVGDEFQLNTMTTGPQFKPSVCRDASGNFVAVWGSLPEDFIPCPQCATTSVAIPHTPLTINGQRFDSVGNELGTEFVVDTFEYAVEGSYYFRTPVLPAVGCAANGSFVVAWSRNVVEENRDRATTSGFLPCLFCGYDSDVFMQRYDSTGQGAGIVQVNTEGDFGYQTSYRTSVGVEDDGDFVVVWSSYPSFDNATLGDATTSVLFDPGDDGDLAGIFAKRFDSAGVAQGSEFQVNTYTTSVQFYPAVAASDDGFTVAWTSYGSDGDYFGIAGRRFDSTGSGLGSEFQVNTYTTGDQGYYMDGPAIDRGDDGDFVVTWKSIDCNCIATTPTATTSAVRGRRRGHRRHTHSSDTAQLSGPALSDFGVRGRLYDSGGSPVGAEFEVSDDLQYAVYWDAPMVAVADTDFMVVWDEPVDMIPYATTSQLVEADFGDVYGRRFARADAAPIGTEFLVPQVNEGTQFQPDVASNGSDGYVVAWGSSEYPVIIGDLATTSGTMPRDPQGVFALILGVSTPTATATATSTATATATATPTATATSTATATPFLPDGVICVDASQCTSGFCTDGVCCETACDGATEVCNLPGEEGVCVDLPAPAPAMSPRAMLLTIGLLAMVAFLGLLRLRRVS